MLSTLLGGKRLDTKCMTCDAVRTLFRSLGVMRRDANNADRYVPSATAARVEDNKTLGAGATPSEINRRILERRKARA